MALNKIHLTRRRVLTGIIAAPLIVKIPGLLMPVRTLEPLEDGWRYRVNGGAWRPLAEISHNGMIQLSGFSGVPLGADVEIEGPYFIIGPSSQPMAPIYLPAPAKP